MWNRVLLVFAGGMVLVAQTVQQPVRAVTDPGTVTTRQAITPAGVPAVFHGRVYGVTFTDSASELYVLNATHLYRLDWKANRVIEATPLSARPGLQGLVWDPRAKRALVGVTAPGGKGSVQLFAVGAGERTAIASNLGSSLTGALAAAGEPNASGQRLAVLPLTANNRLALVDLEKNAVVGHAETGIAPFGAAVSRDGSIAYVTNWGGRLPRPGELTAPTGAGSTDQVVIDRRGIAATGTVTRIDLATRKATHTLAVELHPTAILWDEPRHRLYIANGNKDSISVIDTRSQTVVQTIALRPFARDVVGIAPTALAATADGRRLFVACGGINAVVVIATSTGKLEGMIPTAWYPNALAVSPDGTKLAVGSLLGAGSAWRDEPRRRFAQSHRGAVAVVDLPNATQLASYSTAVAENNHMQLAGATVAGADPVKARPNVAAAAIPARSGEPSLIEHVVYIIKENRTYDQVFGDLSQGNSDPTLVMFGRDVTPNHHRLAEQFVLIDNFYATGGNSADGHQWATQANETAYCLWPGYEGRSYPFDGNDPLAYASGGFLWDYVLARNKTVRVYGEFAPALEAPGPLRQQLFERWQKGDDFTGEWNTKSPIPPLDRSLARDFPSYTTNIPDVVRARIFLNDLKRMEKEGKMPNLVMIQLPSDHTRGASPNASSAKAMVADNDLALGQIVEGLSKSPFWKKMAIFVVEDDAQNGVDHVDGHRTVALAISPYTRRGHVDSTFYSTQSMVKTIELILGLPTMSIFDLIAHDMRNSFVDTPDLTSYQAETPKQSLLELNPPLKALRGPAKEAARASMRMRFAVPDAAPADRLNRILWHQVRGWNTPYPGTKNAVFAPLTIEIDDDDRDEDDRRK